MIQLQNLSVGYKGKKALLTSVSAEFSDMSLTALIGRNGTGKSTLLRALAGLDKPLSGEILIDGKSIYEMSAAERARQVSYVSTTRTRVPALRCRDAVAMGRAPYTGWTGKLSANDEDIVEQSLALTGMQEYGNRYIDTLSDGEWQRIMIARALAQQTLVIILDEPTSFLDIPNRLKLCRLLHDLAHDNNRCIVYSTHELETALKLADNIALIDNGILRFESSTSNELKNRIDLLFELQ